MESNYEQWEDVTQFTVVSSCQFSRCSQAGGLEYEASGIFHLIEIYRYFFSTCMFICISIFSAIKQLQNASVYSSPGILRVYSFDILTDCSCGLWRHLCWQPYSLLCLTWGVPFTELMRYIRKVNYLTREALPHAFFSLSALCWQTQRETFKKRPIGHWGATVKTAKVLCW